MQPDQPANVNPYDFLTNSPTPKRGFSLPGGNSKNTRILLVVAGLVLLLFVGIIFFSLLSSGSKTNTERLISIAAKQQELIRVSGIGISKARTADARNLAVTTELSVLSSQQQTLSLLKKQGHKLSTKDLAVDKKASTDTTLTNADQNNSFDDAFLGILVTQLGDYRTNLRTTYDGSQSKSEKIILDTAFRGTALLLPEQVVKN